MRYVNQLHIDKIAIQYFCSVPDRSDCTTVLYAVFENSRGKHDYLFGMQNIRIEGFQSRCCRPG